MDACTQTAASIAETATYDFKHAGTQTTPPWARVSQEEYDDEPEPPYSLEPPQAEQFVIYTQEETTEASLPQPQTTSSSKVTHTDFHGDQVNERNFHAELWGTSPTAKFPRQVVPNGPRSFRSDVWYQISSVRNSWEALVVVASNSTWSKDVKLLAVQIAKPYAIRGSPHWQIVAASNHPECRVWTFKSRYADPDLALTLQSANRKEGPFSVCMSRDRGGRDQRWFITETSDGAYALSTVARLEHYLDRSDESPDVFMGQGSPEKAFHWTFQEAEVIGMRGKTSCG